MIPKELKRQILKQGKNSINVQNYIKRCSPVHFFNLFI
nr:MAG TPA: hypothetical protein [Caudoviricetes sp.]